MSSRFSLKFVSGHQFGVGDRYVVVENEANWRGVMKRVLHAFDKNFDNNVDQIKNELIRILTESIKARVEADVMVEVEIDIYDESFPRPKGHMRRVKISMNDENSSTAEFCIKKRNCMKTLRDLCLGVLAENINDNLSINNLEIPETLRSSLRHEWVTKWATKRFPSHNIVMLPTKEARKRKMELQMEKEKEPKKPSVVWYRSRN